MAKENHSKKTGVIREAAVAGGFYPGSKTALEKQVKELLGEIPPQKIDGRVVGLISPHAGYAYSGKTAAYGYKALEGQRIKRVIIVAPSHRVGFRGAAVMKADAYRTPLGLVPLDTAACSELLNNRMYSELPQAHENEHSLEVQLPFLQMVVGDFKLIPIIIGQNESGDWATLAAPLKKLLDKDTIIVASSDFTHYGADFGYLPFTGNVKENLKKLDLGAVERIEKLDPAGFAGYVEKTGATICGYDPIGILLDSLPRGAQPKLMHYETSGDVTGDWSHCVSYVSMVFSVKQ